MEGDSIYFGRRANEEREAAMKAGHPAARRAHLDLAARYDELSSAISTRHDFLGLDGAQVQTAL